MNWRTRIKNAISVILIIIVSVGCRQAYVKETEIFATRVKNIVNPNELQAWATNLIARTLTNDPGEIVIVKESEIPKSIRAIDVGTSPQVWINPRDSVQIMYGDGFHHWGLIVGTSGFTGKGYEHLYMLRWEPGIFFWSGG